MNKEKANKPERVNKKNRKFVVPKVCIPKSKSINKTDFSSLFNKNHTVSPNDVKQQNHETKKDGNKRLFSSLKNIELIRKYKLVHFKVNNIKKLFVKMNYINEQGRECSKLLKLQKQKRVINKKNIIRELNSQNKNLNILDDSSTDLENFEKTDVDSSDSFIFPQIYKL
ncbi:hypothetical protein NUSPORA_02908 [Nucleospora cyclopteri]